MWLSTLDGMAPGEGMTKEKGKSGIVVSMKLLI
jgi:hypothetical protein